MDWQQSLRTNGRAHAIGVDDRPLFSWEPGPADAAAAVTVSTESGQAIWETSVPASNPPEARYSGPPLSSRSVYGWRVQLLDESGLPSDSAESTFETALLHPRDWQASWIGRRTHPATRVQRAPAPDHIEWAEAGTVLGQRFTAIGPVAAVSLDLTSPYGMPVRARARVLEGTRVVGTAELVGGVFPWDRFAHYVEFTTPIEPGQYIVVIEVEEGRVGWHSASASVPHHEPADDGLSPLRIIGGAMRDGADEEGTRSIAIEPVPAPNPNFRVRFTLPPGVRAARLHAVGLGYGSFAVNGTPVDGSTLEPAQTNYSRTVLVRTFDVTSLLRSGENELGAELGRGFFALRGANVWGWNLAPWNQEPILIAQLEYEDAQGSRHVVASGPEWEARAGEVVSDLLFVGEEHHLGGSARTWDPAIVAEGPGGRLTPAQLPPVLGAPPIQPKVTTERRPGRTVFDFGSIIAGRVRLAISGDAGSLVEIKYGEYLGTDNEVVCDNVLAAGDAQRDRILLTSFQDGHFWEARFSYKGFRYVEISTIGARIANVVAIPLLTEVDRVGELSLGEETLSWINEATARTFLNNLHGIPTDTPIYEKNGWTADAHLVTEAALHEFDLRLPFTKWLDDHVDAQSAAGIVPQIVPTPGWGLGADPAWSASMVLIPWAMYWEYGDVEILDRYDEAILSYARGLLELSARGVWPHHSWGDWLAPGYHFAPEGPAPTATMMTYRVLMIAAQAMHVLRRDSNAAELETGAAEIAQAYNARYFDVNAGSYGVAGVGYRQSMNILPLAFGAVPIEHVGSVFGSLVNDLETRTGGHLDCGAAGVKHLPRVLNDNGRPDLAMTVLGQQTRPGWGVWRQEGYATLLESWDVDARSRDHYFLGSVSEWIQRHAAGVRATSPGWSTFDVDPVVDDRLPFATFAHRATRGWVRAEWTRHGDDVVFTVTVPRGSTARVRWAGSTLAEVGPGTHTLTTADPH